MQIEREPQNTGGKTGQGLHESLFSSLPLTPASLSQEKLHICTPPGGMCVYIYVCIRYSKVFSNLKLWSFVELINKNY